MVETDETLSILSSSSSRHVTNDEAFTALFTFLFVDDHDLSHKGLSDFDENDFTNGIETPLIDHQILERLSLICDTLDTNSKKHHQNKFRKQNLLDMIKSSSKDSLNAVKKSINVPNLDEISEKQADDPWQSQYWKLTEFYAINGHCNVPINDPARQLWTDYQNAKSGLSFPSYLTPNRIALINKLNHQRMDTTYLRQDMAKEECSQQAEGLNTNNLYEVCTPTDDKSFNELSNSRFTSWRKGQYKNISNITHNQDPEKLNFQQTHTNISQIGRHASKVLECENTNRLEPSSSYLKNCSDSTCILYQQNETAGEVKNSGSHDLPNQLTQRISTSCKKAKGTYFDRLWWQKYNELVHFHAAHGHCSVSRSSEQNALGLWVTRQRYLWNKNDATLTPSRKQALDKLNFDWDKLDKQWEERYKELKKFKDENGHCNVSFKKNKRLGSWVSTQRLNREGLLNTPRYEALEKLDFPWTNARDRRKENIETNSPSTAGNGQILNLDKHFAQEVPLSKPFKSITGSTGELQSQKHTDPNPSKQRIQNNSTGKNVIACEPSQNIQHTTTSYKRNREQYSDTLWWPKYNELVHFHAAHGHCNVSRKSSEQKALGMWVTRQRYLWNSNDPNLTPSRKQALDRLNFDWDIKGKLWQEMYEELKKFKDENGHCNVSCKKKRLGSWVSTQRLNRERLLNTPQYEALEKLGFLWDKDELQTEKSGESFIPESVVSSVCVPLVEEPNETLEDDLLVFSV